ncbi:hypothetical protein PACTADRAFT_49618 [Pachysolen tannophilus NRRL Y-2460]|uniref:Uncharacterized protein n=1 Tax=Pachysolen tannophilus NRRL Y-2460 TaxID=669874 RepID=A0A1E4TWX7_PACTA|nr:hypothetical protein PACTADRAFT_49618 [Pachysolen tannophilus NRRL Y-2460]
MFITNCYKYYFYHLPYYMLTKNESLVLHLIICLLLMLVAYSIFKPTYLILTNVNKISNVAEYLHGAYLNSYELSALSDFFFETVY